MESDLLVIIIDTNSHESSPILDLAPMIRLKRTKTADLVDVQTVHRTNRFRFLLIFIIEFSHRTRSAALYLVQFVVSLFYS